MLSLISLVGTEHAKKVLIESAQMLCLSYSACQIACISDEVGLGIAPISKYNQVNKYTHFLK